MQAQSKRLMSFILSFALAFSPMAPVGHAFANEADGNIELDGASPDNVISLGGGTSEDETVAPTTSTAPEEQALSVETQDEAPAGNVIDVADENAGANTETTRGTQGNRDLDYYTAVIGDVQYETLADAVAAAQDGDTIDIVEEGDSSCFDIPANTFADAGLTINFWGYSQRLTGNPLTGGACIHIGAGNKVTFDGYEGSSLYTDARNAKTLVRNEGYLHLSRMSLSVENDRFNNVCTLSCDGGTTNIGNSSSIESPYVTNNADNRAIDVNAGTLSMGFSSAYSYGDTAIRINGSGSDEAIGVSLNEGSYIQGNIALDTESPDDVTLSLTYVNFQGNSHIVLAGDAATALNEFPDRVWVETNNQYCCDAPEGFRWACDEPAETYRLEDASYVAIIERADGIQKYATLAEAVAAAQDGETIQLKDDCSGDGIAIPGGAFQDQGLTIDFKGFSYDASGTPTDDNAALSLPAGSRLTLNNGSLTSSTVQTLIRSRGELAARDMYTLGLYTDDLSGADTLTIEGGHADIQGSSIYYPGDDGYAVNVHRADDGASATATLESCYTGCIRLTADSADATGDLTLSLRNCNYYDGRAIKLDDNAREALADHPESAWVESDYDIVGAPEGFRWQWDEQAQLYRLEDASLIVQIERDGEVTKYRSIADAIEDAQDYDTITLLDWCAGPCFAISDATFEGTHLTIEFNGYTYTVEDSDNVYIGPGKSVTMQNGTLDTFTLSTLLRSYGNLNLNYVYVDVESVEDPVALSVEGGRTTVEGGGLTAIESRGEDTVYGLAVSVSRNHIDPLATKAEATLRWCDIEGNVGYFCESGDPRDALTLGLYNCYYNGSYYSVKTDAGAAAVLKSQPDKAWVESSTDSYVAAPEDFRWSYDPYTGFYRLDDASYTCTIEGMEETYRYATLAEAIEDAENGDTINMVVDCAGDPIDIPANTFKRGQGLTINLNGNTYTVTSPLDDGAAVRIGAGNIVTIESGTLCTTTAETLVRSLGNTTLSGLNLELGTTGLTGASTVSIDGGQANISSCYIYTPEGDNLAVSLSRAGSTAKAAATLSSCCLAGDAALSCEDGDPASGFTLALYDCWYDGWYDDNGDWHEGSCDVRLDDGARDALISHPDKAWVETDYWTHDYYPIEAPAGFRWMQLDNGNYRLEDASYICTIEDSDGLHKFATLADAVDYARSGNTINLVMDCTGGPIEIPKNKFRAGQGLTINLNGYGYEVDSALDGGEGILIGEGNKVTIYGGWGHLTSTVTSDLVRNLGTLTMDDVIVMAGESSSSGVCAVCCDNGSATLNGCDLYVYGEGGKALNVRRYATYSQVSTYIYGGSISGDVNVSVDEGGVLGGLELGFDSCSFAAGATLYVDAGAASALINEPDGIYVEKCWVDDLSVQDGFYWELDQGYSDETYVLRAYANDVSFDSAGGSSVDTQRIPWGYCATKPEDPTWDGHTFLGWFAPDATEPFDFENSPITEDLTLTAQWEERVDYGRITAKATLTLADSIDVNLYVGDLPTGAVPGDYTVSFWPVNDPTDVTSVQLEDSQSNQIVIATCTAKQMADQVHVQISHVSQEDPLYEFDYSARDYCADRLESGSDAEKAICQAALDYGSYAQKLFSYHTDALANAGFDATSAADVAAVTVPGDEALEVVGIDDAFHDKVKQVTASASLESRVQMNLYVKPKAGAEGVDTMPITVDGVAAVLGATGEVELDHGTATISRETLDNGIVHVAIMGTPAQDLDHKYQLVVGDEGERASLNYSVISYTQSKQDNEDENLSMVCKALYRYCQAAKAYFAG